ncbi:MAG: YaaA family protein [Erysipelotrichaceae bacterium]|nr:YaaA family protein [Erysipelotrichaceae bacterium]
MKIIIAPSKTMKYQKTVFQGSSLLYPQETNYLKNILQQYNDEKLCQLMKINSRQVSKVYSYYHDEYKEACAIELYSGTVFKQLDKDNLIKHQDYLSNINILSALYGVLEYNTLITPYRLDMTMKPNDINLYDYWYTSVYQYFENEDVMISLASHEFNKMIRRPYYFIDFIEYQDNKIKRNATIIKKARGMMLNTMIANEITTLEDLKQITIDGFTYQQTQDNQLIYARKKITLKQCH